MIIKLTHFYLNIHILYMQYVRYICINLIYKCMCELNLSSQNSSGFPIFID